MRKAACLLTLTLSTTALVACGGDDSNDSSTNVSTYCPTGDHTAGGGGPALVVSADSSGAPRFKPTLLTANEPGKLILELKNPSPKCHDIAVKDPAGKVFGHTDRIKNGQASVALDLQPGKYFYYSTIPGEQDAGMLGTLTVKGS